MPQDLGYAQDILTRIINVAWGGGLAVEFRPDDKDGHRGEPSWLEGGGSLQLTKATISFWFRIPQDSLKAANSDDASWHDFPVLPGTIPLIVFGLPQTYSAVDWYGPLIYTQYLDPVGSVPVFPGTPGAIEVPLYGTGFGLRPAPAIASYIGVDADGTLAVNLQTEDMPRCDQTSFGTVDYHETWESYEVGGDDYHVLTDAVTTVDDLSAGDGVAPERLGNAPFYSPHAVDVGYPPVVVDGWNHLILSWDLANCSSTGLDLDERLPPDIMTHIQTTSKLYCALNNVNLTSEQLPAVWSGGGANDVVGDTVYRYACNRHGPTPGPEAYPNRTVGTFATAPASCAVSFATGVRFDKLYIPAQVNYPRSGGSTNDSIASPHSPGSTVEAPPLNPAIYKVEMAELQIFGGLALDTGNTGMRQAFIDLQRDENGHPVADDKGKFRLVPVAPAVAEKMLGRKPDVLLHTASNWQRGKNTGGAGAAFEPHNTIANYKPDPFIPVP